MKKLSFILLMAVATIAKSQAVTTTIDKFTGDTSFVTNRDTLNSSGQALSVSSIRINKKDKTVQGVSFTFDSDKVLVIDNTRNILLKASNDSVLKIKWAGSTKVFGVGPVKWTILLKKEMVPVFKSLDIVSIRFETSEGNYDFDVDKNKEMAISNQVAALNH